MWSLRAFFQNPERGKLFHVMVGKLGMRRALESRPGSEAVINRAVQRCAECDREDSCQAWLRGNPEPVSAPYFCKNHDLFERLRHEVDIEAEGSASVA